MLKTQQWWCCNSWRTHLFSLRLDRGNFLSTITADYIKNCNFDEVNNPYCPIFRVGDVVRYAQQNFSKLADKVSCLFCCSLAPSTRHREDCLCLPARVQSEFTLQSITEPRAHMHRQRPAASDMHSCVTPIQSKTSHKSLRVEWSESRLDGCVIWTSQMTSVTPHTPSPALMRCPRRPSSHPATISGNRGWSHFDTTTSASLKIHIFKKFPIYWICPQDLPNTIKWRMGQITAPWSKPTPSGLTFWSMEMWVYSTYSHPGHANIVYFLNYGPITENEIIMTDWVRDELPWGWKLQIWAAFLLFQAGKFNMIPTLINMVAAFTSVGVVSFTLTDHRWPYARLFSVYAGSSVCCACSMHVGDSPVRHYTAELPERGRTVQGQEIWGGKASGSLLSILADLMGVIKQLNEKQ